MTTTHIHKERKRIGRLQKSLVPVRMSRHEYRSEYLQSEEWKRLRSIVMDTKPVCQLCRQEQAFDVHHCNYRHLVDVLVSDLIPLCRRCHNLVHAAIDFGIIKKVHRPRSISVPGYDKIRDAVRRKRKHRLIPAGLLIQLNRVKPKGQQLACGVAKMLMPENFMEWQNVKLAGHKIDHIKWIVRKFTSSKTKRHRKAKSRPTPTTP